MVKFEACPKCHIPGRKQVLARYPDGHGYCFWCGFHDPVKTIEKLKHEYKSEYTFPHQRARQVELELSRPDVESFPLDANPWDIMSDEGKNHIYAYGLTAMEAREHEILWSHSKQWLIFPYRDPISPSKYAAWQARNMDHFKDNMPKWLNFGEPQRTFHTINPGCDILILVEDIVSAIKVARIGYSVMPVFGKTINTERLMAISGGYSWLIIWLDKDAAVEALKAAAKARQFMGNVQVVETDHDPKYYLDAEVESILEKHGVT